MLRLWTFYVMKIVHETNFLAFVSGHLLWTRFERDGNIRGSLVWEFHTTWRLASLNSGLQTSMYNKRESSLKPPYLIIR